MSEKIEGPRRTKQLKDAKHRAFIRRLKKSNRRLQKAVRKFELTTKKLKTANKNFGRKKPKGGARRKQESEKIPIIDKKRNKSGNFIA